jgi:hypothetical protein
MPEAGVTPACRSTPLRAAGLYCEQQGYIASSRAILRAAGYRTSRALSRGDDAVVIIFTRAPHAPIATFERQTDPSGVQPLYPLRYLLPNMAHVCIVAHTDRMSSAVPRRTDIFPSPGLEPHDGKLISRMTPVTAPSSKRRWPLSPTPQGNEEWCSGRRSGRPSAKLVGPRGRVILLPRERGLRLRTRGGGHGTRRLDHPGVPVGREVTTPQAAELNVPRQYLVRLLDDGRIHEPVSGSTCIDRRRGRSLPCAAAHPSQFFSRFSWPRGAASRRSFPQTPAPLRERCPDAIRRLQLTRA